ncbi:DUF4190 domain-containing protein [Streptomyces sp. NPDC005438]|uniref:DUF4190 domain-containing protein n=1 Tax=Streptomyces sp. NPDC005438 TaxID=3156880 RepID=UPI0033B4A4F3
MVMGIVGLAFMLTCYGGILSIIASPVALGLGLSAKAAIARGEQGGYSQAHAGVVMGIIGLVGSALLLVLLVFGRFIG